MKQNFRKAGGPFRRKTLMILLAGVLLMMSTVSMGCKKKPDDGQMTTTGADTCSLVVDIAKEASSTAHTFESIQALMDSYAQQGLKQVCFRPIPDTYAVTDAYQGSVVCDASLDRE